MARRTFPPPIACSRSQIHRGPNIKSSPGRGIKPHSAYRLGFVVVEYRWHPLHGKRVRLLRRTVHDGSAVVHVDVRGGVSRELPAWMVDASVCRGMEQLGPPEVSLAALNELRCVLSAASAGSVSKAVSSLHKENRSGETAAKTEQSTDAAVARLPNKTKSDWGKREGGSNQSARRRVAGSSARTDGGAE